MTSTDINSQHGSDKGTEMSAKDEAIVALLDAYDAETSKLPLGHEMRSRGASTYNWRRAVADDLRKLAGLPPYSRPHTLTNEDRG
jgi:hypothetical protein